MRSLPHIGLTEQFALGTWYRHTLTYDASAGQLVWDIVLRDSGTPFFSGTYDVGSLPAFDQISVGYHGVPPQYGQGWAEIWVDNMRLTAGAGGVIVTPSVIDEDGSTTLTGGFTDPGVLDTHTVVIDWGDGSPNTTLSLAAGVTAIPATAHQYLDNLPGSEPYTITATVTDGDAGDSGEASVLWEQHLDQDQFPKDTLTRVEVGPDGGVYAFHHTFTSAFPVEKLDPLSGAVAWSKTVNVPSGMSGTGWVDNDGNVHLTSVWGGYTVTKYDPQLDSVLWTYRGGSGFEYVWDLTTDDRERAQNAAGEAAGEVLRLPRLHHLTLLWPKRPAVHRHAAFQDGRAQVARADW
jgi:hypothetical protein